MHGKADWSSRKVRIVHPDDHARVTRAVQPCVHRCPQHQQRIAAAAAIPVAKAPYGRVVVVGPPRATARTGGSGMSPMSEHRAAATVDCMSTLDDWIMRAAGDLALPPDSITADLRIELLDVTRDVAHGVARVAGPLTCYLIGVAVGRGDPPHAALATLKASLAAQVVRQNEESDTHVERES